eukprot:2524913-Prymnesium_polylepis.1
MLGAVRFNRAGEPPTLDDYLDRGWAERFPDAVGLASTIFVPVGLALHEADDRRLRRPTPWNATIVRTLRLTRGPRANGSSSSATGDTHTKAALLDLLLCRNAEWFMGWSGSTYSRLLGLYQRHDRGRGWLVACPRVACRVDAG